jgi:hypothetical protein
MLKAAFHFLEQMVLCSDTRFGRGVYLVILSLILLSVLSFMIETLPARVGPIRAVGWAE